MSTGRRDKGSEDHLEEKVKKLVKDIHVCRTNELV